jgi:hypothetical protein
MIENPHLTTEKITKALVGCEELTVTSLLTNVTDKIASFKTIKDEDIEEFTKLVNTYVSDRTFAELLIQHFNKDNSTYNFRTLITLCETFPAISYNGSYSLLTELYDNTSNSQIKRYLLFLLVPLFKYVEHYINRYIREQVSSDALFEEYLLKQSENINLRDDISHFSYISHQFEFANLGFICQNDDSNITELTKLKYANILIRDVSDLHGIINDVKDKYNKLTQRVQLSGFDIRDNFGNAVKIMSYLAPAWDRLSACSLLRMNTLPSSLVGGGRNMRFNDSDVVRIFAGEYSLIPMNYTSKAEQKFYPDIVTNFNVFDQLSQQRKAQVAGFLMENVNRFNNIIGDSTHLILDRLHNKLFDDSSVQIVRNALDKESSVETFNILSKFKHMLSQNRIQTVPDGINFIVHSYIPMINTFNSKLRMKYGDYKAKQLLVKFHTNPALSILGVDTQPSTYDVVQNNSPMFGGARHSTPSSESSKPIHFNPPSLVTPPKQRIEVSYLDKGGAVKELVDAFVSGQREFNTKFEELYRQLTSAIAGVKLNVQPGTNSRSIYRILSSLESLSISSSKTPSKLSGYYGAKNHNKIYTFVVTNTIRVIDESEFKNEFNSISTILRSIKTLLEETAEIVKKLRLAYITAPKSVSEQFIASAKSIKQDSKLSVTEFNRYRESISRLYQTLRSNVSESKFASSKQQFDEFMKHTQDRETVIKEHYEHKKMIINQFFSYSVMNNTVKSSKTSFERTEEISRVAKNIINDKFDRLSSLMVWLSTTVDTFLMKERMENNKIAPLTEEQISKIEHAFTAFQTVPISEDFKKLVKKINHVMNQNNISTVHKLIKHLKALILKSNYLSFIVQAYKELNIFSEEFNWKDFCNNIITILVLSHIEPTPIFEIISPGSDNTQLTFQRWANSFASTFENYARSSLVIADHKNLGRNFIIEFCNGIRSSVGLENASFMDLKETIFTKPIEQEDKDTAIEMIQEHIDEFQSLQELGNVMGKIYYNKLKDITVGTTLSTWTPELVNTPPLTAEPAFIRNEAFPMFTTGTILPEFTVKGTTPTEKAKNRYLARVVLYALNVTDRVLSNYSLQAGDKAMNARNDPYLVKIIPLLTGLLIKGLFSDKSLRRLAFISNGTDTVSFQVTPYRAIDLYAGQEVEFVNRTIDAFLVNIVAQIDKYWAIKYHGILSFPINISQALRGGSVFDSVVLHDQSMSTVVPEATPFYICAINMCSYYCKNFNIKNLGDTHSIVMNVTKISFLYPIWEIFVKYSSTIESLTTQQIKTIIGVLNDIWNQTSGNNAVRLSESIDIIFNELNSCFLFTNKINYELIKATGKLSRGIVDSINETITKLVDNMQHFVSQTIVPLDTDPETANKIFENMLSNAYKTIKDKPESQRIAGLKFLLTEGSKKSVDSLQEYYKFMDLVIAPMLVCAKSYLHIFSVFDSYSFSGSTPTSKNTIDLRECKIMFPDLVKSFKDSNGANISIDHIYDNLWSIVQVVRNNTRADLKALFIEHPVVLAWNKLLLQKSLDNLHTSGKFVLPDFWIVMDEHTYPVNPKLEVELVNNKNVNDNIITMRQLWPTVHANTVADYYNQAIQEFVSDFDHFVHAFVSYPNMSDRTIKIVATTYHDSFKVKERGSKTSIGYTSPSADRNTLELYSAHDKLGNSAFVNTFAENLSKIRVQKVNGYIYPPPYPVDTIIPRAGDVNIYEELQITSMKGKSTVEIDGLGLYVISNNAFVESEIRQTEYSWFDWVIFNIARCDKTQHFIPYKFLTDMMNNNVLSDFCIPANYEKNKGLKYKRYNGNIITQNIISRSLINSNKDKGDYMLLNASWIANIVSIIPYLISTLKAVNNHISQSVTYLNVNVSQLLGALSNVLCGFYDEISTFTPFLSFMADSVTTTTKPKPHIFAELVAFLENSDSSSMNISDFIRLEWANVYAFSDIENIQFPTFKNRDRFEWIREFAEDKIGNVVFSNEFDTSISVLGRLSWACLISKSVKYDRRFKNVYRELDEVVVKSINILSECDTKIIQQFVDNVVNVLTTNDYNIRQDIPEPNDLSPGLKGGYNQYEKYISQSSLSEDEMLLIGKLTNGIYTSTVASIRKPDLVPDISVSSIIKRVDFSDILLNHINVVDYGPYPEWFKLLDSFLDGAESISSNDQKWNIDYNIDLILKNPVIINQSNTINALVDSVLSHGINLSEFDDIDNDWKERVDRAKRESTRIWGDSQILFAEEYLEQKNVNVRMKLKSTNATKKRFDLPDITSYYDFVTKVNSKQFDKNSSLSLEERQVLVWCKLEQLIIYYLNYINKFVNTLISHSKDTSGKFNIFEDKKDSYIGKLFEKLGLYKSRGTVGDKISGFINADADCNTYEYMFIELFRTIETTLNYIIRDASPASDGTNSGITKADFHKDIHELRFRKFLLTSSKTVTSLDLIENKTSLPIDEATITSGTVVSELDKLSDIADNQYISKYGRLNTITPLSSRDGLSFEILYKYLKEYLLKLVSIVSHPIVCGMVKRPIIASLFCQSGKSKIHIENKTLENTFDKNISNVSFDQSVNKVMVFMTMTLYNIFHTFNNLNIDVTNSVAKNKLFDTNNLSNLLAYNNKEPRLIRSFYNIIPTEYNPSVDTKVLIDDSGATDYTFKAGIVDAVIANGLDVQNYDINKLKSIFVTMCFYMLIHACDGATDKNKGISKYTDINTAALQALFTDIAGIGMAPVESMKIMKKFASFAPVTYNKTGSNGSLLSNLMSDPALFGGGGFLFNIGGLWGKFRELMNNADIPIKEIDGILLPLGSTDRITFALGTEEPVTTPLIEARVKALIGQIYVTAGVANDGTNYTTKTFAGSVTIEHIIKTFNKCLTYHGVPIEIVKTSINIGIVQTKTSSSAPAPTYNFNTAFDIWFYTSLLGYALSDYSLTMANIKAVDIIDLITADKNYLGIDWTASSIDKRHLIASTFGIVLFDLCKALTTETRETISPHSVLPINLLDGFKYAQGFDFTTSTKDYELKSRPGMSKDRNRLRSQKGGAGTKDVYSFRLLELIYSVAWGTAKNHKARAVYIDPTITLDKSFIPVNVKIDNALITGTDIKYDHTLTEEKANDATVSNDNFVLYKFNLNPNLVTLFNKQNGLSNTEYIQLTLGIGNEAFIIDPNVPESLNKIALNIPDPSKIKTKLSPFQEKMLTSGLYPDVSIPLGFTSTFYDNLALASSKDKLTQMERALAELAIVPFEYAVTDDKTKALIKVNVRFTDGAGKLDKTKLKTLSGQSVNDDLSSLKCDLLGSNVVKKIDSAQSPHVIYSNWNIKPRTTEHIIKFDELFFTHVPWCPTVFCHIYSPQKDIYNATFINDDDLPRAPTVFPEVGDTLDYLFFPRHVARLVSQWNSPVSTTVGNFYAGNVPSFDRTKNDFDKLENTPIHEFMSNLINIFVSDLFDGKDTYQKQNLGFNVGRSTEDKLTGGYYVPDTLTRAVMNTKAARVSSPNGMSLLSDVYNNDKEEATDGRHFTINPCKKLFYAMFKHIGLTEQFNSEIVFKYVINYFHKYNIKFSSMFNQLTFPSILFGSGVFRSTLRLINSAVSQINSLHPDLNNDSESYDGVQFRFIRKYLELTCDESSRHLFIKNIYQIGGEKAPALRSPDLSFNKALQLVERSDYDHIPPSQLVSNQYQMPSVNNAYLSKLLDYLDPATSDKSFAPEANAVSILNSTSIIESLRYMDISATQLSMLFTLLKKTSFYNYDLNKDQQFIQSENNDIFSS